MTSGRDRGVGISFHELTPRQPDEVPWVCLGTLGQATECLRRLIVGAEFLLALRRRIEHIGRRIWRGRIHDLLIFPRLEEPLYLARILRQDRGRESATSQALSVGFS